MTSSSGPVKSPLHNFPIPPTFFKWGSNSSANSTTKSRRTSSPSATSPPPETTSKPDPEPEVEKPWKLRPRRTTTTTTTPAISSSMANITSFEPKSEFITKPSKDKRFFIALSKEEIEEDIYAFTGSKPSRRPKKRSKTIQKELDKVFPGLWLVGLSADSYRDLWLPTSRQR